MSTYYWATVRLPNISNQLFLDILTVQHVYSEYEGDAVAFSNICKQSLKDKVFTVEGNLKNCPVKLVLTDCIRAELVGKQITVEYGTEEGPYDSISVIVGKTNLEDETVFSGMTPELEAERKLMHGE